MANQVDPSGNLIRTPTGNSITVASSNAVQGAASVVAGTTNAIVGTAGSAVTGIVAGAVGEAVAPVFDVAQKVNTVVDIVKNPTLGGVLALAGQGFPPYRNELDQFASYSYNITLGCLTNLELNFPLSYRTLGPAVKILRSGGTGGNKIPTLYETDGMVEFFIEDLEIKSHCAPNPGTRLSNATSLSFKIIEPYSMGQFLHNLRTAALVCGHPNYVAAPFVLSIEFIGYDDEGNVVSPMFSRRHIPFRFVQADMSVTEAGAVYECMGAPYNETAMTDNTQSVVTDMQIKGQTVSEALQSGAESLASKLNSRQIDLEEAGQVPAADYYIISFPQEGIVEQGLGGLASSLGAATLGPNYQVLYESIAGSNAGDIPADLEARLQELPGVQVLGSALAQQLRTAAESNINSIGNARILPRGRPPGRGSPMQEAGFIEDENNSGFFRRGDLSYNSDTQSFSFPSGTRIQDMIEELVLNSDFGRNLANEEPDENGQITHFIVVPQVYNASSIFGGLITGRSPRIYVYQVLTYKVDEGDVSAPTSSTLSNVLRQAQTIKAYNYIYTGQNKDIIDLDLQFNTAFQTGIVGNRGQTSAGTILDAVEQFFKGDPQPAGTTGTGGRAGQVGTAGAAETTEVAGTDTGNNGGGPQDDTEVQVARNMNDMIINSSNDMIQIDLTIHGDPYYLSDIGISNILGIPNPINSAITIDGAMNPIGGQVLIALNFRTPVDYDEDDGFVKYPLGGFIPISFFSGVYQVLEVENRFTDGKFTQQLTLGRKRNQELLPSIGDVISAFRGSAAGRALGLGNDGDGKNDIRDDVEGLNE